MKRSAIKTDLFAGDKRRTRLDKLGDPLALLDRHIDFAALAAQVDRVAPRPTSAQGGRPPYPTETMVRLLVVKRLHNLSDEQLEFQLLDRMSFQRFCGLSQSASIPDRTTVWTFENRIGAAAAQAIFEGVQQQLDAHGYLARCGQIVDATIVPAPRQHFTREEKALVEQDAMPVDWTPAKRCRRTWMPAGRKSTGRATTATSSR